ncbi:MAG: sulfotransferase domain-containing protein [Gammaproteobacteria bacterium]|nr:MAG: sulfotransferase domain-containing protein [Gammaproteobacteria bacterium]
MIPIRDSVKKVAILAPTALLPRPWRVATRRKLLSGLELAIANRAGLLIIGHPKSGNTWLKVMLARLYQVRHGLEASALIGSDELALRNSKIPRLAATNAWYSYEGSVGKVLAADAPDDPLRHKPVILLARNPIDIAVSWFFQFTRRQSAHKQELINHFIDHPIDRHTVTLWDFVRYSDIGLPFLIDYLNTWERNLQQLDNSLLVRYEDLRAEPAATLKQVIRLMGEEFTDEEIAEAVAFGSFDNLRKLETSGFFRRGGMRLHNAKDPDTFKTRRGKVGGYPDYFTPDQVRELEDLMMQRLSPTFGYRPSDFARPNDDQP